ncbi:ATP synthase F1 subunit gamma [Parachlamydia sp. AcF125]|uniref:ATP synthase F1 subunit gamma n=1 Tax=Parachlamydia sp. AcF125 TaxID=2795736 RepID=UPI001BC9D31F|nr:ATP synthase F1 subunit gamma [Parachlamydia sp. AcF125]MBS4167486.1 ATP synthase gamma chain [Parachlamydia sp. AcF125]
MSSLRDIRKRLHSVENIRQMTEAMEMVAASQLRRAKAKAEQARPYALTIKHLVGNLSSSVHELNPFFMRREVKKTAVVIIAGDRGLCGSYNTSLFATAERFLSQYQPEHLELILIGSKTVEYFKRKAWSIRKEIVDWGGKLASDEVKTLSNELVHGFEAKVFDEVWLVYTHYVHLALREIKVEKFLNIHPPPSPKDLHPLNYLFEPSADVLLAEIIPRYCFTILSAALNEAYAAELSARIFSMRTAVKNAEELIEKLTLERNKVRQMGITTEMLEITSGTESLRSP